MVYSKIQRFEEHLELERLGPIVHQQGGCHVLSIAKVVNCGANNRRTNEARPKRIAATTRPSVNGHAARSPVVTFGWC